MSSKPDPVRVRRVLDMYAEVVGDTHENERFRLLPPSHGVDDNWHLTNQDDTCVAHCFGFGHDVALGQGLAVRIVAALNHCRGIQTSELVRLVAERDATAGKVASDGVIYAAVSQRADPAAHASLAMQINAVLGARPSPAETDQRDAQRYRWLRSQHWHDNTIAAVYRPKDAMKLGHEAPAGERLDELIDQALNFGAKPAG